MATLFGHPPTAPICRRSRYSSSAAADPCPFWTTCPADRQQIQESAGYKGDQCWAWQKNVARFGDPERHEAQVERAALQEGL